MTRYKERPIIFNSEMVRSILENHKSQTRRVIKPQPIYMDDIRGKWALIKGSLSNLKRRTSVKSFNEGVYPDVCPFGQVGDRLWVKESWRPAYPKTSYSNGIIYKVDKKASLGMAEYCAYKWKSPLFMPRWASRLTLEITDIRVERLQEITPKDIEKEGVYIGDVLFPNINTEDKFIPRFKKLWNSIHKKEHRWEDNPFVWVITFRRIK